jgi:hypothetical protein
MKKISFVIILNLVLVLVYYISTAVVGTQRLVTVGNLAQENEILRQEIAAKSSMSALSARAQALGLTKVKIENLTPTSVAQVKP